MQLLLYNTAAQPSADETPQIGRGFGIRENYWSATALGGIPGCPFAKRELEKNRVRFSVTEAVTEEQLLVDLQAELEFLNRDETVETTLLIHPGALQEFYNC